MTPINNSDTAWLIVSDYNQEHDIPYEDLRNDIYCPSINDWMNESIDRLFSNDYNVGDFHEEVGTIQTFNKLVVGGFVKVGGEFTTGALVGGNEKYHYYQHIQPKMHPGQHIHAPNQQF